MGNLKLGTISLDDTKIKANASKNKTLSWKYANQLESQFMGVPTEMLQGANNATENTL
jgi:hypothetical protein